MKLANLFKKPDSPMETERLQRQKANEEFFRHRSTDPMLSYWNKDVRWVVCTANMGPGGEYFTGVEIHAMWNRPEEVDQSFYVNGTYRFSTSGPAVKYSQADYRLVAIGVLPDAAGRIAELRNKEVLGS